MSYPWMKSRYNDREEQCMLCSDIIPEREQRMWHMTDRKSAHVECVGKLQMNDKGHVREQAPSDRDTRIAEMHKENYDATKELSSEIRALRATLQSCAAALTEALK